MGWPITAREIFEGAFQNHPHLNPSPFGAPARRGNGLTIQLDAGPNFQIALSDILLRTTSPSGQEAAGSTNIFKIKGFMALVRIGWRDIIVT